MKNTNNNESQQVVDSNGLSDEINKNLVSKVNITDDEKNVIILEESACIETLNNYSDFHGLLSRNSNRSSNYVLNLSFGFSVANLAGFAGKYVSIAMQTKDGSTFLFKRSKGFNFPAVYRNATDYDKYVYMVFWELFISFFGITCLFKFNKEKRNLSYRETVAQISAFGLPYGLWSYINLIVHPTVNYSLGSDRGVLVKHFNCDSPEVYFPVNPFVEKLFNESFSKGEFTRLYSSLTFLSNLHNSIKLDTLFYTEDDSMSPSVLGAGEVFYAQDQNKNFYINSLISHGRLTSARISFSVLFDIRLVGTPRFKQYSVDSLQANNINLLNLTYAGKDSENVINYMLTGEDLEIPVPKSGLVPSLPSTVTLDASCIFAVTNYVLITGNSDLLLNSCWFILTGDTIGMTFSPLYNGDPATQSIGLNHRDSTIRDYADKAMRSHGINLDDLAETGKELLINTAINTGIGAVLNRTPVGRVVGLVARAQGALPPRIGNVRR